MDPDFKFHVLSMAGAAIIGLTVIIFVLYNRYVKKNCQTLNTKNSTSEKDNLEMRFIIHSLDNLIMEIDYQGQIIKVFPTQYRLQSHKTNELEGCSVFDILPRQTVRRSMCHIRRAFKKNPYENTELLLEIDGIWFQFTIIPSPSKSKSVLLVGKNITHVKKNEHPPKHEAYYDSLTGLPTHELLTDRLNHTIDRLKRKENSICFILFIDLNRFRIINETLGKDVGDYVLQTISEKLRKLLRKVDTVARFDRDEFIILLEDLKKTQDAFRVVERIQNEFSLPLNIREHEIFISASIGMVYVSPEYEDVSHIIRDAETAMYQAKVSGRGYRVFHAEMHEQAARLLNLETDLRKAIKRKEFTIFYQPIIDLESNNIVGLEALIRWIHPEKGIVSPGEFIPIAEETGLIIPIGTWVLKEACNQVIGYMKEFSFEPPFILSVNISVKQFAQTDLPEIIENILTESGFDPGCLKLEITESVMMSNTNAAYSTFSDLKKLGVCLAIDDFGTGYSSLSYLHRFPFDILKIDRSFVKKIGHNHDKHLRILQAIMSLADHLEMGVVAEGIEEQHQLELLKQLKCPWGQGFLFSKPLDNKQLRDFLKHRQRRKISVL